jgi:hypothetical protein
MQEAAVKKCAEVAAFIALADEIIKRAGQAFAGHAPVCHQKLTDISAVSFADTIPNEHRPLFDAKTNKTVTKLTTMMELYIGDEWDNPIEVLEWCSFYAGAGAAHCAISAHLVKDGSEDPSQFQQLTGQLETLEADFRLSLDATIGRLAS